MVQQWFSSVELAVCHKDTGLIRVALGEYLLHLQGLYYHNPCSVNKAKLWRWNGMSVIRQTPISPSDMIGLITICSALYILHRYISMQANAAERGIVHTICPSPTVVYAVYIESWIHFPNSLHSFTSLPLIIPVRCRRRLQVLFLRFYRCKSRPFYLSTERIIIQLYWLFSRLDTT